ncbi:hypothetical protein ASPCAL05145 [Aspergillus calidoustus]|uniref:Major facilitator superfamily (MFS) profile domain-containing protein n=1 Tax=Aspergillus calidoustus TaxID=454130 RepID=A0A0U5FWY1_ASPCI|nr:hypothetical protein ASPCAL05145 [Aspergillus calidoustus]
MGIFKKGRLTVADDTVTNAAQLTLRQSLLPNILVTVLFFLWGFAYGLLDVLNSHFQTTLNITPAKASGLSASYFGAYFLCPLTISGWILRRFGFRLTFVTGLAVLAVGCLMFWPSGIKKSFGGFCGSMFIVGAGLSTLETAADPFLAICGPPKYSEIRLNLAQAVQGVGGFVAPLLASRVFFAHTVDDDQGLKNVQWVYLGVAGFVGLLIILFLFVPFPEITDADMGAQEAEISDHDSGPFRAQYTLFLGVFSQFCYVGAQVAVANYFINFAVEAGKDKAEASDLFAVAQAVYAANRFIAGGLMVIPAFKPRYMLLVYLSMCTVFSIICIVTKGTASVAMLIMVFVFESCCFATIFSMSMRGLGRHTKRGGSFLVAAISGGAAFPPMMGAVVTNKSAHTAMAIPMLGYILALTFPVYVNLFQKERMDSHRVSAVGIAPTENKLELSTEEGKGGSQTHIEEASGR